MDSSIPQELLPTAILPRTSLALTEDMKMSFMVPRLILVWTLTVALWQPTVELLFPKISRTPALAASTLASPSTSTLTSQSESGSGSTSGSRSASPSTANSTTASREGTYQLINGTQGCPNSVIWIDQCQGFVLDPRSQGQDLETEKFCHLQLKHHVDTDSETGVRIETHLERQNNYLHKSGVATDSLGITTTSEDTLLFDTESRQFQWEHSRNQRGYSCLYSK